MILISGELVMDHKNFKIKFSKIYMKVMGLEFYFYGYKLIGNFKLMVQF